MAYAGSDVSQYGGLNYGDMYQQDQYRPFMSETDYGEGNKFYDFNQQAYDAYYAQPPAATYAEIPSASNFNTQYTADQTASQQAAYNQAMGTAGGWDLYLGKGDLSPYSYLNIAPDYTRGGPKELTQQMAQQGGWTPQQYMDWTGTYNQSHTATGDKDSTYSGQAAYDMAIALGASPAQAEQYRTAGQSGYNDWTAQQEALNADHGLSTFLMLLAAGVGGGALLAGGLGAGIGGNAAAAMGLEGAGAAGGGFGAMDLAGIGAAMDSSIVGSAVPGFDLAAAGMYPLSGAAGAITSLPTFTGGFEGLGGGLGTGGGEGAVGWDAAGNAAAGGPSPVGSLGGTSSGNLTDIIKQIQQMTGQMPPGSTSALQKLLGGVMGGGAGGAGGAGGGAGTGTGGLGGMGDIFNWLTSAQGGAGALAGILGNNDAEDQTDWMKATMERAIGASDPYGYGPYRQYAADQLQKTYQDPAAIYNSAEMQGLDKMFMDKTMAEQAASGNLFNAPERVAQRQNNFYSNLKDYRQPLIQMSGADKALVAPQTMASFANSVSKLQGQEALAQGNMIGGITGGLNSLFGGGGTPTSGVLGAITGGGSGGTGGLGDLSSIWNTISGGGVGGWDDWFGASDPASSVADSFYGASDLLDLWL